MRDERNDLIRVGDVLDAITDWLCEEELRHGIEPSRKINKFFAKVMLEKVPRTEVTADTPQTDRPCDKCEWHKKYGRCIFEYCHYEYEQAHKDTPQTDIHDLTDCDFCKDRNCKDCEGGKDEPQTDCPWK